MNGRLALALRLTGTLVVATVGWAVLGYLATLSLGADFGWSGHPAIPAAPIAVNLGLYLVVLPAACLVGAWWLTGRVEARTRGCRNTRLRIVGTWRA